MKMLAAAKLRRAQDAVIRARPYAQLIEEMLASLAEARARDELPPHPLMAVRPPPPAVGGPPASPGGGGDAHLRPRAGGRLQLEHHPPRPAVLDGGERPL